jgi:quercetin dioxygenase-like cupin family protein
MKLLRWTEVQKEAMNPLIDRQMIVGEKVMMARVFLRQGAVVPEHRHESEQHTFVLSGALQFGIEGRTVVVRTGEVLVIPSWVPHSAVALEDTDDLDVFSPLRDDWLRGDDAYLRGGGR